MPVVSGIVIEQLLLFIQHTPKFFIVDTCHAPTAIVCHPATCLLSQHVNVTVKSVLQVRIAVMRYGDFMLFIVARLTLLTRASHNCWNTA
jgi:hypothetical protein